MKKIAYKDLVKIIPQKARILISHAASIPVNLIDFLCNYSNNFKYLEIIHMNPKGKITYCDKEYQKVFKHKSFFLSKFSCHAVKEDRAEFIPINFSETPRYIKENNIDIFFGLASRRIGNKISLGISIDYGSTAIKYAKKNILIQNDNVPYTIGDGEIATGDIDYLIVDNDFPLTEYAQYDSKNSDKNLVIERIANNIVRLIDDGSVLQVGVGSVPDKVLEKLINKNDLGIHTEMFSDGFMKLIKNGNVTNKTKKIHKGISTATFAMGTRDLYNYVDKNNKILFKSVDYINDPFIIGTNDRVVSINSAVAVDLMGQVNAETIEGVQVSGVGGQVDFVRGARISREGKSIIAFPSTTNNEKISRIVCHLGKKDVVTTSRNDIDFVCTEYGCVRLTDRTLNERKKLLITIAHPKFRDLLKNGEI